MATAGPSRVTVSSEAEETAAENGIPIESEQTETLYLHNLNEKVQIPGEHNSFQLTSVMKETLKTLFKPYRPLGEVVAHRNVRMRGQAFVSFHDKESAARALAEVNEFPLYGKPMIVAFARTRSDVVVAKKGNLEEWKKQRLEEKSECALGLADGRNKAQDECMETEAAGEGSSGYF